METVCVLLAQRWLDCIKQASFAVLTISTGSIIPSLVDFASSWLTGTYGTRVSQLVRVKIEGLDAANYGSYQMRFQQAVHLGVMGSIVVSVGAESWHRRPRHVVALARFPNRSDCLNIHHITTLWQSTATVNFLIVTNVVSIPFDLATKTICVTSTLYILPTVLELTPSFCNVAA